MISARDIMKKRPSVVKTDDLIQSACRVLIKNRISGAPVIDKAGRLVGFISEKDIIKFLSQSRSANKRVEDIMKKKVKSVDEGACLDLISKIFSDRFYRCLPVTSKGKLVGVINRADIMDNLLAEHY